MTSPFRPERLRALLPALLLLGVPFVAGCVLAIGNRVPEEQLETAGFEITTGDPAPSSEPKAAMAAGKPSGAPEAAAGKEKKLRAIERDLASSRRKLEIAELERENAFLAEQRELERLGAELEVARSRLATFREVTLPSKTRTAELDLDAKRHALQDAQDELRQLEMLYTGNELEDRTAEIVLARGRRQLEHAQGRLEVAELERDRVIVRELPLEAGEKERELGKAEFAVAQHQRAMAISALKADSERTELRQKIEEGERELAELAEPPAGSGKLAPAAKSPGSSR